VGTIKRAVAAIAGQQVMVHGSFVDHASTSRHPTPSWSAATTRRSSSDCMGAGRWWTGTHARGRLWLEPPVRLDQRSVRRILAVGAGMMADAIRPDELRFERPARRAGPDRLGLPRGFRPARALVHGPTERHTPWRHHRSDKEPTTNSPTTPF
jgi:hypothetical protein